MEERDPLRSVLREWEAPAPSSALDERVRAAYRAKQRPAWWRRLLMARVSIPVPALAALLLLMLGVWWFQFRPRPAVVQPVAWEPPAGGYMTLMEPAGFRALPHGAVRVIRAGEVNQ